MTESHGHSIVLQITRSMLRVAVAICVLLNFAFSKLYEDILYLGDGYYVHCDDASVSAPPCSQDIEYRIFASGDGFVAAELKDGNALVLSDDGCKCTQLASKADAVKLLERSGFVELFAQPTIWKPKRILIENCNAISTDGVRLYLKLKGDRIAIIEEADHGIVIIDRDELIKRPELTLAISSRRFYSPCSFALKAIFFHPPLVSLAVLLLACASLSVVELYAYRIRAGR